MSIRFVRPVVSVRRHEQQLSSVGVGPSAETAVLVSYPLLAPETDRRLISREPWISPLSAREARRRLWHLMPGLLPILFWFVPHRDPIRWPQLLVISLFATVAVLCGCFFRRTYSREGERDFLNAALGYGGMTLLSLLLYPGQPEVAMLVLATLAFGDGTATLSGLLFKGPKLPWNHHKSWAGSVGFVLAAFPMGALYYWAEARPCVSWTEAFVCATAAVTAGVIAESIPSRINDNIRVPLAALASVVALHQFVLGWH